MSEEKKIKHQIDVNDVPGNDAPDTWVSFKEKLESVQEFPGIYAYKFVIPGDETKLAEIKKILPNDEFAKQPSKTGKYVSITVKKWMQNADDVVEIYKKVGAIEGVMML